MPDPRVTGALRALGSYGLLVALIAMGLGLAVTAPGFASVGNTADMLRDLAILGIMAVGETLVIIGGGIDLSVGSILMLAGILSDNLIRGMHLTPFLAVPIVLAACTLVGLVNGLLVTRARIPAFIVTLAGLYAIRGVALSLYRRDVTSVASALINDPTFLLLGQGDILRVPISVLVFLLVLGAGQVLLRRTRFGLHLYAVGGNELAARLSGIDVDGVRLATFTISGFCAGLSGVVLASRLQTGAPEAGVGAEFDVIGAVVIGGASLLGGHGTLVGTLVGAAFIIVLAKGQSLLGVPANYQSFARGAVILLAVVLDGLAQRRRLLSRVITRAPAAGVPPAAAGTLGEASPRP